MPAPRTDLNGKTIVITGATSGIGRVLARSVAGLGGHVVLVARDPSRLSATRDEIIDSTRSGQVEGVIADLAQTTEVRRLIADLDRRLPRVDVLVNNAGAIFSHPTDTVDGIETTWALNVVAPFLLTRGLSARLTAAAPSRVVMVASEAHRGARLDFNDLEGRHRRSGLSRYGASKLALILLTHEFARQWAATGVTVNAVHPGLVRTRFGLNNMGAMWLLFRVGLSLGISAERGARTPLWVATDPGLESVNGRYFLHGREGTSSRASYDDVTAGRLWANLQTRFPEGDPVESATGRQGPADSPRAAP